MEGRQIFGATASSNQVRSDRFDLHERIPLTQNLIVSSTGYNSIHIAAFGFV